MVADKEYRRLFFALWPSVSAQNHLYTQLHKKLGGCQGRQIIASNLHMTLLFLGNVGPVQQGCLESLASQISSPEFDLNLHSLIYRRKQQMLWLEPDTVPDELRQLVNQLREATEKCGFKLNTPSFKAHMTVMRKLKKMPDDTEISPYFWAVRDFTLVSSKTLQSGAEYRVLKTWSLGDPGDKSVE